MERERFVKLVGEVLDSLPKEFRERIHNLAVLVEDRPPKGMVAKRPGKGKRRLLLGIFHGVPATMKSTFNLLQGPDHIVIYQKNIETICFTDAEIRHEVRQTVLHEIGHYLGMTEEQLKDV